MTTEKKRISFIKCTKEELKELSVPYSQRNALQEVSSSASKKKVELGFFDPTLCEGLEDYAGDAPPKNSKKEFPSRKVLEMRRTTTSRRSTIANKVVKKKTVDKVNTFLSNTTRRDLNVLTNISQAFGEIATSKARKALFPAPTLLNGIRGTPTKERRLKKGKESYIPLPASPVKPDDTKNISPSASGATLQNEISEYRLSPQLEFKKLEKICEMQELEEMNKHINRIDELIEEDRKLKEAHEKIMLELTTIQNKLKVYIKNQHQLVEKENMRPLKIPFSKNHIKETPIASKTLSATTPIRSTKNTDLRTNLMKSNLAKSSNKSSSKEKAQNMYKNLRQNFSILETPKLDNNKSKKSESDISYKLQAQCLMLLETPQHK